ncbi:hypothetical protein FACS189446_8960 [Bacteroidia bacterium]|nr:hypothetical protein FACS189446_8960 [Bacteroidia bacterium]
MEKEKTEGDLLNEYLKTLNKEDYVNVCTEIIISCKIAYYTLGNWRQNKCKIPPLAKDEITKIVKKNIFK